MPTTQTVNTSPTRPPTTSPATVMPGASPANSRVTTSATPSPNPAPRIIINCVSCRRDFSGGAEISGACGGAVAGGTGRFSSVATSAS